MRSTVPVQIKPFNHVEDIDAIKENNFIQKYSLFIYVSHGAL